MLKIFRKIFKKDTKDFEDITRYCNFRGTLRVPPESRININLDDYEVINININEKANGN